MGVKSNIPSLQGNLTSKLYLEWECGMELVFNCYNYTEVQKAKLAMVEFSNYAITWWDQLYQQKKDG